MPEGPKESLLDRVIREAMERGEFDDLPGAGKPIPGVGKRDDQWWWFRRWVRRNSIDPGPPPKSDHPNSSS